MTDTWDIGQQAEELDRTVDKLLATGDEYAHAERSLRRRADYTDEGLRQRLQDLRRITGARIRVEYEAAQEKRQAALRKAERIADEALKPADTAAATLLELQVANGWQRVQPLLDAQAPAEVIAHFRGDTAALRALHANLPAWVQARMASTRRPGGVTEPATRAQQQQQLAELQAQIEDLLGEQLPPDYRIAIHHARRLRKTGEVLDNARLIAERQMTGNPAGAERIRLAYARNS